MPGTTLVTGASSGIGRELARLAAKDRRDVVLVARRRERLEALADELTNRYGVAAEILSADLSLPDSPARVFAHYESACRKVFGTSFRGALLWRSLVSTGGLDLIVGAMNRPVTQRMLARSMARM